MPKISVYVPDDLDGALKTRTDINVSQICQSALRGEIERQERLATLTGGMKWIVLHDASRNARVRFTGRELAKGQWDNSGPHTAYLTAGKRIALHGPGERLTVHDTLTDLIKAIGGDAAAQSFIAGPFLAEVAAALGDPYTVDLDI